MISAFNKRIEPKRIAGLPEPVFFTAPLILVFVLMAVVVPLFPVKIVFLIGSFGIVVFIVDTLRWHDYTLIRKSMERGKRKKLLRSWGGSNQKTYLDGFTWQTRIGDHGLMHQGDSVSVAIGRDGVKDRHWSEPERANEHRRRVALLRALSDHPGLVVENHLLRVQDSQMADAYLREAEAMHQNQPMPPIDRDIRKRLVDQYRPLARSNQVITVLSMGKPVRTGVLDFVKPVMARRNRNAQDLYAHLLELFKQVEADFPGAALLSADDYQRSIQRVRCPDVTAYDVEWRFPLADQIVTEKPVLEDECLKLNGRYFKTCLLQGYPDLPLSWTLGFVEAPVDLHACQIVIPKAVDKAMDEARKQSDYESDTISRKRGADKSVAKIRESNGYREYVIHNNLPVADNAYMVTFSGQSAAQVKQQADAFKRAVHKEGGLVRDNADLQHDLFDIRLPGMGRNSFFAREDHGDVLAAMMPVTTFAQGNTEHPESLRITMSGQLVGFAPSRVEVPHELVVAQTGGGKDTQFGLRFLETYPLIRYDIIEMGNSYQAAVEAVGGSYCRAREQVINPLAGYEEYQQAKVMTERGHGTIDVDFIRSQSDMLTPIFKGLAGSPFTRPEEVCVNRALRLLYGEPSDQPAPTLPDVLEALKRIEISSDGQKAAQASLCSELFEFLETEVGSAFKSQDQFTISPIANAIDFGGFTGELFQFYMTFMVVRLATNAMARGARSQIVLNEYRMLLQNAGDPIRWITLTLDRMGRKDWVGLTRITQGIEEIRSVDSESLSSIQNRTLLSREDSHAEIGELLQMPPSIVGAWQQFGSPDVMNKKGYREGLVQELGVWHKLFLKFPPLVLDLMNTRGEDKKLREIAFEKASDPYERIDVLNKLKAEREAPREKESLI
jgi:hypothetical protein